jgi:hypothetical protein
MSPEAQRIAIAKSVGIHLHDGDHAPSNYTFVTDLPDYLNDLNAIHEAEKCILHSQKESYWDHLYENCQRSVFSRIDDNYKMIHSTAAQRSEAYLRTIGKWEGGSDE